MRAGAEPRDETKPETKRKAKTMAKTTTGYTTKSHEITRRLDDATGKFEHDHGDKVIEFLDKVFAWAEKNYARGGDVIVECYSTDEVLREFRTLGDVQEFCGVRKSREDDIRGLSF